MGCGISSRRASSPRQVQAGKRTMPTVVQQLGPDLYRACIENDVSRVRSLTSRAIITSWPMVLIAAASAKAEDVANFSLTQDNQYDSREGAAQYTIMYPDSDDICRYLINKGFVDPNHDVEHLGTLLGCAAEHGRHALALFLLNKGARPNDKVAGQGYISILACAAGFSDAAMVRLLLEHHAEVQNSGALIAAAREGKEENVKLLLAHGADVNEVSTKDIGALGGLEPMATPLHQAVENGHLDVMKVLLRAGADVSLRDKKGRTAADIAVERGMDAKVFIELEARE